MGVVAIVLAAGAGSRMGADKLALPLGDTTLLGRALRAYEGHAAITQRLLVVRPGRTLPPEAAGWIRVDNPDADLGMGSSLRAGIAAAHGDAEAFLLGLGDLPSLASSTVAAVLEAGQRGSASIVHPSWKGRRGHPVLVSARYRSELSAVRGDQGARALLRDHPALALEVSDPGCALDVDTPADLARMQGAPACAPKVLIKGAGEHASGTAHRLFRCGFRVVMTEVPCPTAVRRWVSFASAVWDGAVEVEGVAARRWALEEVHRLEAFTWDHVPVVVDPQGALMASWRPDAVIDARILKRNLDNRIDLAPLVIGYGPGLEAGRDVHVVVETNRGHDLGRVIRRGQAAPDTGVPGEIAGQGTLRVLRAPGDGPLAVQRDIGSLVQPGEQLAEVAGAPVRASIAGVIRGMVHPASHVLRGQKLGDIDPRGDVDACSTISDKARTISGAALELLVARFR